MTQRVCPPELWRALAPAPEPAADAVVEHNASGGDWIEALIDRAVSAVAIITAARAACVEAGAAPQ